MLYKKGEIWGHHNYNILQGLPSLESAIENLDSLLEEMAKVGWMRMQNSKHIKGQLGSCVCLSVRI